MDTFRLQKAEKLRAQGKKPFAASFKRSASLSEAKTLSEKEACAIAGRVVLFRSMGKMTFATLQDHTGRMQISFKEDVVGKDLYKDALSLIDLGDFIGISGERFTTQKGEPTVMVKEWTMLTKALRQPPEKWHGIADRETAYRQRYLDILSNRESFERFLFRSAFLKALRKYYWENGFTEVEIPVLVNSASGALAAPFTTHHNALDLDVYLRIALETHQKECLVGGFDRTFSLGPVFRNEGMDPSHLQEFTMCEHYAAYWDYRDNMRFTEEMLCSLMQKTRGTTVAKIPNRDGAIVEVDFGGVWPRISMREIIKRDCGIDYKDYSTADALRTAIKGKKIELDLNIDALSRGTLIDQLYKKVSRPKITAPTFITEHPIDLSPLARRNDDDPSITDRFQLVVGGWEIVNAYSELVDPVDQAARFASQAGAKEAGDTEAHGKDDEFVTALSYGCPPCSGWGMGIDRIVALLTAQENLKDVVLFPLMKPEERNQRMEKSEKMERMNDLQSNVLSSRAESRDDNTSHEIRSAEELIADEKTKRFVAVLNKKIEPGRLMNALGHMAVGLGGGSGKAEEMRFSAYLDKDGGVHPKISDYPFIVLRADNANQIRTVRQEAINRGIPFTDFTDKMTVGTAHEQHQSMGATPEAELEYYGICLFGKTEEIAAFTKKFSLFK
ncbi:MAG: lysine--tRNA ligase [Candidatus Peregrinibacteria bacterium]